MESHSGIGNILGDSGYGLRDWLLTPVRNEDRASTAERRYNRQHRRTRVIIEQAFGRLKMDWRVLHNECRFRSEQSKFLLGFSRLFLF
ncbi:MAG: hypothetical protein DI539_27250 [Flavobacterium psychrophilum]|nr:MAG: hypothetical protein DI539_27250 [Flavobacterium psychrophilum]